MAGSGFRGVRWRPPAPRFPVPKRSDPRTMPPLTFLALPGTGPEHVAQDSRDPLLDLLLPRAPALRAAVWSLPDRLKPEAKNMAWALAIDKSGTVVHDLRGWKVGYHEVTAVREHDGKLYMASIAEPAIARAGTP